MPEYYGPDSKIIPVGRNRWGVVFRGVLIYDEYTVKTAAVAKLRELAHEFNDAPTREQVRAAFGKFGE